jgi:hypothetical protein
MRRRNAIAVVAAGLAYAVPGTGRAQLNADIATEPAEATMVYEHVENFARALRMLVSGGDTVAVLQAEYVDRASPALKTYAEKHGVTAEALARAMRRRPEEYAALADLPERLAGQEPIFRAAYGRLQQLLPDAVFPPTHFVIGVWSGASEASEHGQLISVERPYIP